MISITSQSGSSNGVIFIESKESKFKTFEPRVTKSQTLDGGVVYDHRGMIEADREFNIIANNLNQTQIDGIQNIIENETYINVATDEAFFQAVIQRAELDNGFLRMTVWVYVPPEDEESNTRRMFVFDNLRITENISIAVT